MGSLPLEKAASSFDPKLLQVNLVSEISVFKREERPKKSNLKVHRVENIIKNNSENFVYFLFSKFDALKELSFDDELDDGNPIEIRKIDINKNVFPKRKNHVKFSKIKNSNKHSKFEKIKNSVNKQKERFSCQNFAKRKFYIIDDLKEKVNFGKIEENNIAKRSIKSQNNLNIYHNKKYSKTNKNKDYIKNLTLSTIKSKKSDCDTELNKNENGQKNGDDSLDRIRKIIEEMGN